MHWGCLLGGVIGATLVACVVFHLGLSIGYDRASRDLLHQREQARRQHRW